MWDPPTKDDLRIGLEAAQEGLSMGPKTQRERDYLGAIQIFYQNAGSESHGIRAKRYETAMELLHTHYPQDSEAAILYALSLIANASLKDETYANQKKATLILAPIILQQPQHPGVAHYIMTIAQGVAGTFQVSVAPTNGFNAPVSLSVSGLPTGFTFQFSPPSVTPAAGQAANATLTISAGASTAQPPTGYLASSEMPCKNVAAVISIATPLKQSSENWRLGGELLSRRFPS
ncbi:hypothetical protein [Edaphobacter aggregans]|uniref:hypothetical protein n=1 Tax=Edaphobacter aggregans TaxID=570835 RepID=UPI0011CFADA7|nr:hypothetical protein [Edaphobacter aggregans]